MPTIQKPDVLDTNLEFFGFQMFDIQIPTVLPCFNRTLTGKKWGIQMCVGLSYSDPKSKLGHFACPCRVAQLST